MHTLMIDTRQQAGKHTAKDLYFEKIGIPTVRTKLLVGDYQYVGGMVAVDTKRNIQEVVGNLCEASEHRRFRAEADLAYQTKIKLYVLIENTEGIRNIDGLIKWSNPRYKAWFFRNRDSVKSYGQRQRFAPVNNVTIIKILRTFSKKHHVEFVFCHPNEAGQKILELLGDPNER